MRVRYAVIASILLLSGCISNLQQLKESDLSGNTFQAELARQYLDFAEAEADQYDWFDSAYFAKKGLKISRGEEVGPEELINWSVGGGTEPTLAQAREYLVSVITPEVTEKFPQDAARAQFLFDCWVEQQEENWQEGHIEYCREEFYSSMDKLFALATDGQQPPAKPEMPVIAKEPSQPEITLAYFKTGSAILNNGSKRMISNIISRLKSAGNYDITLNGYADRVGGEEANMKLSKKRAMNIKKALIDGGLEAKNITIFAFGETQGREETKDGVASKENRVVEVVVDVK